MWLSSQSRAEAGIRLVRYSLLVLISFMLVCTSVAIILVSFIADYSSAFQHRKQGILAILVLITLNYAIGLYGVWRAHLPLVTLFGLVDVGLTLVCLSSSYQYHHMGNFGALFLFTASSVLSITWVVQSCGQRSRRRACSVQNASVNCYRHVDEWYEYATPGTATAVFYNEKDELMASECPMPYHQCQCVVQDLLANQADHSCEAVLDGTPTVCTVESTDQHYLRGDRYAL